MASKSRVAHRNAIDSTHTIHQVCLMSQPWRLSPIYLDYVCHTPGVYTGLILIFAYAAKPVVHNPLISANA